MSLLDKLFEKDGFNLTLRTIYFRDCSASMSEDFDPLVGGQKLAGQLRKFGAQCVRTEFPDTGGVSVSGYVFLTKFEFRYVLDDKPEVLVASISATVATCYYLKAGAELDNIAQFAWGESSALFHAWPYWREYAQSALARLNLPVALMPMLDVQAAAANAEEATVAMQSLEKLAKSGSRVSKKPSRNRTG